MKAKKSTARPPKTIAESQDKYMSKQETAKRAKRREVRFFKAMKKTEHSRKERLDYSFQKHRQLNPSIKNTKKERLKFEQQQSLKKACLNFFTAATAITSLIVALSYNSSQKTKQKNANNKKRTRKPKKNN